MSNAEKARYLFDSGFVHQALDLLCKEEKVKEKALLLRELEIKIQSPQYGNLCYAVEKLLKEL